MSDRSDLRLHLADEDLQQDAETREARHELLASFLAASADGELPAETQSQLDAHLAGCARCRRELSMHRALRERLGREPVPAATAALRERIATGIRYAPPPTMQAADVVGNAASNVARLEPARPHRSSRRWRVAGAAALFAAIVLVVALLRAGDEGVLARVGGSSRASGQVTSSASVPLFAAVLTDYRRVTASDLPGRARDLGAVRAAVPFPVTPLANSELRLLAAWTTSLAGEPAAVLAYRWNDRVVLQYLVSDALLFQSPNVRALLAQQRDVVARDGNQGLLLWAQPESGSMLVGELSPAEFSAIRAGSEGR